MHTCTNVMVECALDVLPTRRCLWGEGLGWVGKTLTIFFPPGHSSVYS